MNDNHDNSSGTENSRSKYELSSTLKMKLKETIPEALAHIRLLEKKISKQKMKLKKLKAKIKDKRKTKDISTQTDNDPPRTKEKTIAEEITEAAELATQRSGFVYDENSGMYYDSNTGYYYNSEYGLYYDASTGTYLTYSQDSNSYEFHSRVDINKQGKESVKRKKQMKDKRKVITSINVELLSSSFSHFSISSNDNHRNFLSTDITRQYPPCMRLMVEQSSIPKIKIGSLHILTCDGGTLGREGANHAILLPDINISKCHLKFTYDNELQQYFVVDLGSKNGTILNGKRMAGSQQESERMQVAHGSRIQMGSIVLLCHVHEGTKTCGLCEPGLIQQPSDEKKTEANNWSKSENHKHELKKLKKKFGVTGYEEGGNKLPVGYTDRAQHRRQVVGSQNPHEKTQIASIDESIPSQNKGFKMLEKMGWKEGESLGKDNQGIVEPVQLVSNAGTSGMGNTTPSTIPTNAADKNKQIIWKKTQERFQLLPSNNVFDESD